MRRSGDDALINRGFTPGQSVEIYRAFASFLLGHLVLEAASLGPTTSSPVTEPLNEGDAGRPHDETDLSPYPALIGLQRQLPEDRSDAEFVCACKGVLDLIDLRVSQ